MKSKTAALAATAKPCPNSDETVTLTSTLADTIFNVAERSNSVLQDYRDGLLRSGAHEGIWIGDEEAALELAVVTAAIEGTREVMAELSGDDVVTMSFKAPERPGAVPEATESLTDKVLSKNDEVAGTLRFQSISEHNQLPAGTEPVTANFREQGHRWVSRYYGSPPAKGYTVYYTKDGFNLGDQIAAFTGEGDEKVDPAVVKAVRALVDSHNDSINELDPESIARIKFAHIDDACGETDRRWAFDIDPDGTYDLESVQGIVDAVIALDDIALRVPEDQSRVLTALRGGIWELLR